MVDEVKYRCLNEACGRAWPRPVAFCPYCGRAQRSRPAPAVAPPLPASAPVPSPAPPASRPPPPAAAPAVAPAAPDNAAPVFRAPSDAARPKFKFSFGRKPMRIPELPPELAERRGPGRANRPGPRPIRKRTWLMVAMALAAIWLFAKPRAPQQEFASEVDAAMALVDGCKLDQARTALSALKSAKAPPAQLVRVQNALREAGPVCQKKRARAKTEGARAASLLDEADACLARKDRVCLENRLNAADKLQRPELAQRIAALREALSKLLEATLLEAPSPAGPAPAVKAAPLTSTVPAQQWQTVLAAARHDMAQSNYRAAADRLGACAAVVSTGNSDNGECRSLKQQAERLNTEMLRCLANQRTWMDGTCL